jgi:hypothetical protein
MSSIIKKNGLIEPHGKIAKDAYEIADAMLAARGEPEAETTTTEHRYPFGRALRPVSSTDNPEGLAIRISSDIWTLKKARKLLIKKGFSDNKAWNETYEKNYDVLKEPVKHYIHVYDNGSLVYWNNAFVTKNEFLGCEILCFTSNNLQEAINIVVQRVKK